MIVPMIDQALAQARLLIGGDPEKGGVRPPERAKYEDRGRSFSRVPAREWRRLLNEALPRVGLVLVTESEALTGGDLTVTFSLTHVGCGDVRSLTRVEPLPPAKSRSMGKQWAHTRAVNAIARTLLWQWDDEDEAADDAEDDADKIHREEQARASRPARGQRPNKATRAANSLAGHLTGAAPAIEYGQAEQEHEEQRAAEAERAADERAAASPSAPVADPDWLDEEREQVKHLLEDRLRVELERTRDQIQVDADRLSSETSTTAPDAVSGAAPLNEADEATDEELGAEVARQFLARENDDDSTDAGPSPAGGSAVEESSPAPEPDSPGQGASPGRAFVDAFLVRLAAGGVVADVTRLRTPEQPAAIARAWEDAPEGSRVVVFAASGTFERAPGRALVENVLPCWDLTHVIEAGGAYIPGQSLPTLILVGRAQPPSGAPVRILYCHRGEPRKPEDAARGLVWSSVVANYDRPGHRDEWTWCADVPRQALFPHPWRLDRMDGLARFVAGRLCGSGDPSSPRRCDRPAGHDGEHDQSDWPPGAMAPEVPTSDRPSGEPDEDYAKAVATFPDEDEPEFLCSECGAVSVDTEGEVCGLCVTTEARCAECDLPLAADSTECPDPACPSNERQGTAAEALDEVGSWGESPAEVRRAASPPPDGPALTMTYADGSTATIPVPPRAAKRLEASIDSGDTADGRKGRAARWRSRPKHRAKAHNIGDCAECGRRIDPGDDYHKGVAPDPKDPGRRLSKRGQPVGVACVACVQTLEQGEDPRAQEETTS